MPENPFKKRKIIEMTPEEFEASGLVPEREEVETDPEQVKALNESFIKDVYTRWYPSDQTKQETPQFFIPITPDQEDYQARKEDKDPTKFGEITYNPETVSLTKEQTEEALREDKLKVLDLADQIDKPLQEVAQHIIATYSRDYFIPGLELWKWLSTESDGAPDDIKQKIQELNLKDGNWNFFFGSLVRDSGGDWHVPSSYWNGSEWNRVAHSLGVIWSSLYRLVLLEK